MKPNAAPRLTDPQCYGSSALSAFVNMFSSRYVAGLTVNEVDTGEGRLKIGESVESDLEEPLKEMRRLGTDFGGVLIQVTWSW